MVRVIKSQFYPSEIQSDILRETMIEYSKAMQSAFDYGYHNNTRNKNKIHEETYANFKKSSPLNSDLIISARGKAVDTLVSLNGIRKKTGINSKPVIYKKYHPMRYNNKCSTLNIENKEISLATIVKGNRIKLNLHIPKYYQQYIGNGWEFKSLELILRDKRGIEKWYIHFSVEKYQEELDFEFTTEYIGIKRGMKNLIVSSKNKFYSGKELRKLKTKNYKKKQSLQKTGTRSAKRKLKENSGREKGFQIVTNHEVAKNLINDLQPNSVLILEDLAGIRDEATYPKQSKFSRELNTWAYYQLELFIEYRAAEKNIRIEYVDPHQIQQICSKCGYNSKSNRKNAVFRCGECGFELNADLNASRNLVNRFISQLPIRQQTQEAIRFLGGAPVIVPNVTS
ncbi:MAG: hypothetical protein HeimC2_21720 [Candidatus Heimdallarchaeota archaeon LC_2]|nr:MAG: hypothetical protein HeimC2_21720 [Candidatus Heimdallarchaeota archaeon LC_2]